MKEKPLLLALVLATALAAGSCALSKNQEEGQPSSNTPTQSAVSATASATSEEDMDGIIRQLFWDYEHTKDVTIDGKTKYVDSSGTDWIRFDAHMTDEICRAGPQGGPTGPVYGFMKRAPGENWELVNLGIGDIQCGVPTDVQTGLGFAVCPASEEELDKAIEDFLLSGPGSGRKDTDVKISRKVYYADPSGTDWAEFCLLSMPNLTGPTYGIMKRVPGETWGGVNFGSAAVECGLPADVQAGLGFPYCPHG